MKLKDLHEKTEGKKEFKCPKCGTVGTRKDKDGHVVAYGCFHCSPVKLPKKRK